jgi:hypothetical protein
MTSPREVFDVELVVCANQVGDFLHLFEVPNSRHSVELDLNEVLANFLLSDHKVFVNFI